MLFYEASSSETFGTPWTAHQDARVDVQCSVLVIEDTVWLGNLHSRQHI